MDINQSIDKLELELDDKVFVPAIDVVTDGIMEEFHLDGNCREEVRNRVISSMSRMACSVLNEVRGYIEEHV